MIRTVSGRVPTVVSPGLNIHERRSSEALHVAEAIEMQPLARLKHSRPAISGQRRLHPLRLGEVEPPQRRTRLTDTDLLEAEASWTTEPYAAAGDSYTPCNLNKPFRSTTIQRNVNRLSRPRDFEVAQADGTTAHVGFQNDRAGLLLSASEGRNLHLREKQRALTRPYFWGCALSPITAMAFGLGALDWKMAELTEGKATEMDPEAKKRMLLIYAPLSSIGWAIVVILVIFLVAAARGGL